MAGTDVIGTNVDLPVGLTGLDLNGNPTHTVNADANGNLQVVATSSGPVVPGTVALKSNLIGGQFNTALPTLINTQQSAIQLDSSGRLIIRNSEFPSTVDVNYGAVGTSTLRVASQIGNSGGSADFNYGAIGAQTLRVASQIGNATGAALFGAGTTTTQVLRVVLPTDQTAIPTTQSGTWTAGRTWTLASGTDSISVVQNTSPWITKDQSDGPVTPGTVASFSQLSGGQFNTALPTLANTQQSSIQLDSSGRLIIAPSTNSSIVTVSNLPTTVDTNYGTVGASTVRTASQIGNATGVANFNSGVTGAQTLRVASNSYDGSGNAITSSSNGNAGNQLIHVQTPDTTTASTALGALNASVQISVAGQNSVGFQIAAGTLIGTLQAQISIDGGISWLNVGFYDTPNSSILNSLIFGSSNTLKILSVLTVGGTSHVKIIVTAYTSGTANAILRASEISPTIGAIVAAAFGTTTNTFTTPANNTITLLLASNTSRKYACISNPSGSQLTILLSTTGTGLTTTTGIIIPAKGFFELKGDNLWTGNIYGFMGGGASLTITEGTP